jgi:hypothetical protein
MKNILRVNEIALLRFIAAIMVVVIIMLLGGMRE